MNFYIMKRITILSTLYNIVLCCNPSQPQGKSGEYGFIAGGIESDTAEPYDDVAVISDSALCQPNVLKINKLPSNLAYATGLFVRNWASGSLVICGGNTQNEFKNHQMTNKCYSWAYGTKGWTELPEMNNQRGLASSVVTNNDKLWILGGINPRYHHDTNILKTTEILVGSEYSWIDGPDLPTPLASFCALRLDDDLTLIAGGRNGESTSSDKIYIHSWSSGNWSEIGQMLHPRMGHSCSLLDSNTLVIAGGMYAPYEGGHENLKTEKINLLNPNDKTSYDNEADEYLWSKMLNLNNKLIITMPVKIFKDGVWSDVASFDINYRRQHLAIAIPSYMLDQNC